MSEGSETSFESWAATKEEELSEIEAASKQREQDARERESIKLLEEVEEGEDVQLLLGWRHHILSTIHGERLLVLLLKAR